MRKFGYSVLTVATGAAMIFLIHDARSQEPQSNTAIFMRQKLVYSQGILEGMALEHYGLVVTNATKLLNMSQTNVWTRVKSRGYREKTAFFQKNVADLIAAAQAQNSTNMLKSWSRISESCMNCHQTFRTEQFVRDQTRKE